MELILNKYSVLMSVYYKEKPEHLYRSMQSIYNQTVSTDNFVLVCDGPLNDDLNAVIEEMQGKFRERLHIHRLNRNVGLGNALTIGLLECKNELVARMDSDDISMPYRCQKELEAFIEEPWLDIISGIVIEFEGEMKKTGMRKLPVQHDDIVRFSKKRNPFNHPAVMFKKSSVLDVGGYSERYHFFEDYYLWIRMLKNGCIGKNLEEPLLFMRTSFEMYTRRGGMRYVKDMMAFHKWMLRIGWSCFSDYCLGTIPHAVICILPNQIRKIVYRKLHT